MPRVRGISRKKLLEYAYKGAYLTLYGEESAKDVVGAYDSMVANPKDDQYLHAFVAALKDLDTIKALISAEEAKATGKKGTANSGTGKSKKVEA